MSAPQPLTGDELAAIKARAEAVVESMENEHGGLTIEEAQVFDHDVPRLVAEVERLRAQMSHPVDDPECVASPCEYHEVLAERDVLLAQVAPTRDTSVAPNWWDEGGIGFGRKPGK